MENFFEKFEKNLRKYLKPLEEGTVLYDFSFDLQTMHIIIFAENLQETPGYLYKTLMIDVFCPDEEGNKLVSIDNRFFRETTKEDTEKILRKAIEVIESEFQVQEKKLFRDDDWWRMEKGSFYVKRKHDV